MAVYHEMSWEAQRREQEAAAKKKIAAELTEEGRRVSFYPVPPCGPDGNCKPTARNQESPEIVQARVHHNAVRTWKCLWANKDRLSTPPTLPDGVLEGHFRDIGSAPALPEGQRVEPIRFEQRASLVDRLRR